MRETSAWAWSFDWLRALYSMSRKHGRGRPRLHWLVLLLLGSVSLAQSRLGPAPAGHERRGLQVQWFLRGRSSSGQPGAARRYRAYLQKMRMRATRLARAQKSGTMRFRPRAWFGVRWGRRRWPRTRAALESTTTAGFLAGRPRLQSIPPIRLGTRFISAGRMVEFGSRRMLRKRLARIHPALHGPRSRTIKPRWP